MDNATDTDFLIPDLDESGSKKKVKFSDTVTVFHDEHSKDGKFFPATHTLTSLRAIIQSDDHSLRTNLNSPDTCSISAILAFVLFLILFCIIFALFVKKLLLIEIESNAPIDEIRPKK